MKIVGTRTYLEVRVGRHQSVEILLQLRRCDVTWLQTNWDVLQTEFFDLLQWSVLPRLFATEMELNHASITRTQLPPELGPGGIPMTIGEKNKTSNKTTTNAPAAAANNNNKRKRGLSKKKQAELKRQRDEEERELCKNEKDIHYATGETLRIVYRTEPVRSSGATLLFHDITVSDEEKHSDDTNGGTDSKTKNREPHQIRLSALKKLSKRILVWCYPANAEQPASEGFWRPDVIPVASLFRMPASEVAAANNIKNSRSNKKDKVIDLLQEDE